MRNHFHCHTAGRLAILLGLLLAVFSSSCDKRDAYGVPVGDTGLKSGINYMQPNKWEMKYEYWVKQITPTKIIRDKTPSEFNPKSKVVGKGTYEVYFTPPIESDEVRHVELVSIEPEPTRVEYSEKDGLTWYYWDVAPDDRLPETFKITATWTFYTFERYVHWKGIEDMIKPYDKDSELYKRYTQEGLPYEFHAGLVKDARDCRNAGDPDDVLDTTLAIYNYIIANYMYDHKHNDWVNYGEGGLVPTSRVWLNKRGVCDEFANLFVTMARSQGIPARACAGMSHQPNAGFDFNNPQSATESLLDPGGHAWAEFYVEGVGWIPVDATWGDGDQVITPLLSPMGFRRNISWVDYYYGKMDPYRLTMYKDWNYELMPAPRTPDARKVEPWFVGTLERYSGIRDMVHGFGESTIESELGNALNREIGSESMWDSKNSAMEWKFVQPPKEELDEIIQEIKDEGYNYIPIPGLSLISGGYAE
ncbi:transglutaminase domain-containing protein [bacterium]|nr:transglutaminase domain-containing protein [bacterium]